MNDITICAALEVYRNPKNLQVLVEKNIEGSFAVTFQREPDKVIFYSWSHFTTDFEEVRESIRSILRLISRMGTETYLKKGTFLFDYYNLEGEVVDENLLLDDADIERICREIQRPTNVSKYLTSENEYVSRGHVFI